MIKRLESHQIAEDERLIFLYWKVLGCFGNGYAMHLSDLFGEYLA